jgi:hypothetical protein
VIRVQRGEVLWRRDVEEERARQRRRMGAAGGGGEEARADGEEARADGGSLDGKSRTRPNDARAGARERGNGPRAVAHLEVRRV